MTTGLVRTFLLNIKDIQDLELFASMTSTRWFDAFKATPFYQIMFPIVGIILSALAVLDVYDVSKATNKNLDRVLNTTISIICAVLSNVSIYGALIATLVGGSFAAAPWLFFTSIILAITHQGFMSVLNAYRALCSPKNSVQRMNFLQTSLMNAFFAIFMSAITSTFVLVLATSAAPLAGSILAGVTFTLVLTNLLWRVLPQPWREALKSKLYLTATETPDVVLSEQEVAVVQQAQEHYKSLFVARDFVWEFKHSHDDNDVDEYLNDLLDSKIELLSNSSTIISEKSKDKIAALTEVKDAIGKGDLVYKYELINKYPLAFQSFWLDIGEVEAIVNTVIRLKCTQSVCVTIPEVTDLRLN